ncbi:MAG: MerR family transcriptional regulator [Pseudobdellovibrionaceae bacterium]|nr:MerR family transcriptional regulator [Pseudobdellovibrionaceae bacterium]
MNESKYSLKAVCKLTGLRATTLHAWEKRYGAVTPLRTDTNHRFYTSADVEKIRLLVTAKDLGQSISHMAQLSLAQLQKIVENLTDQTSSTAPGKPKARSKPSSAAFCKRTLQALEEYDLERVHEELAVARNRFDTITFVLEILVPLFSSINRLVEKSQIGVPKEHALSAIVKANIFTEILRLRVVRRKKPGPFQKPKRIAVATFDGDWHEIGILLSAVLCSEHGLLVSYLGPSIPAQALAEAVTALRSDILLISCPKVSEDTLNQKPDDYIRQLADHLPKLCDLWLGGEDTYLLTQLNISRKMLHIKTLHDLNKQLIRITTFPTESPRVLSSP